MTMDEIVLKFKSEFSKMKSELSDVISKFQKLDNETSKSGNNFEDLGNPLDKLQSKLKSLQGEYDKLSKKFERTKLSVSKESFSYTDNPMEDLERVRSNIEKEYDSLIEHIAHKSKELETITDEIEYNNAVDSINELNPKVLELLHNSKLLKEAIYFKKQFDGKSYDDVINSLKTYQTEISETKTKINELSNAKPQLVPNAKEASKDLENVGNKADEAKRKINGLKNSSSMTGKSFNKLGINFKNLNGLFDKFGKSFSKVFENKTKDLKKLALGLIGVRTAMSVLTKAVNAYLSFDSELQDSITNSWNTLGALLAPAIELVAQMFALATNYIAQFVSALSNVDLIARANAKALETQAKATEKANKAQRGLLSMDEITNLPTEPAGAEAKQIKTIDTKPIKWLANLLKELKKHDWHRAGEIIAESIDKGLKKIDWDSIRDKAEQTGKNIGTFLNGLFEVNWRLIGSSFANGLNTLVDLFHGFFTELEWGRLGAGVANAINGFFNDFDFVKVAETINAGILGILDATSAFIANLDEEKIFNSMVDFLEKIDWIKIGEKIIELLIHGIRLAVSSKEVLWSRIADDIKKALNPKIEEVGEKIGGEFGKKIANALKDSLKRALGGYKIEIPVGDTKVSFSLLPKFLPLATGTNEIESEGLYHLHEGEAVVPKKYNPTTGGYNDGSDNKQIIDLLVSLNASMLQYAERPININMNSRKVAEATYDDLQQVGRNKNVSTVVVRS